jgi:hypothetical protein
MVAPQARSSVQVVLARQACAALAIAEAFEQGAPELVIEEAVQAAMHWAIVSA